MRPTTLFALLYIGSFVCDWSSASSLPDTDRDVSEVRYLLWTRSNPDDYYVLEVKNSTNLAESFFDGQKRTYFVQHGWQSNGDTDWVINIKTNLLTVEDANVISIDWGTMADIANYNRAANNVYIVAAYTASFIDWLVNQTSLQTSNIHLMGHSLGAHSSGLTGKYVTSGKIDRISGFDPAGPFFYNKGSDERLDKNDATFVDVIHTNSCPVYSSCAGLGQSVGHVDFFPNGGMHQPGCNYKFPGGDWMDFLDGCSHGRSHEYFAESVIAGTPYSSPNSFVSWPCQDYEVFEADGCPYCNQGCLNMGFYVDRSLSGNYFLNTNHRSPYAKGNIQW